MTINSLAHPKSDPMLLAPLAVNGGPKAVTASARDRWRSFRWRDAIPILKHLRRGEVTSATGEGAVADFEQQFAQLTGTRFALAMNSGTAALHSGLFAVGVGPGDEVIVPSYTYHATASAILCCGATPVFCDLDPRTLTADPADIARRITARTKAIIVVHLWGNPAEMDTIKDIAGRHGLMLVEDCSHAHGASYKGKPVGSWGDVGCFSLQGEKPVSAGEGGVAVCSDPKYYDRMLALGLPVRLPTCRQNSDFGLGVMNLGPKYRPHLFGVLLARASLARLPRLNGLRRRNWDILCDELAHGRAIAPVQTLPGAERGGFYEFKLLAHNPELQRDPEGFVRAARAEGIPLSPDRYGFLHLEPVFNSRGPITLDYLAPAGGKPQAPVSLSQTESLRGRIYCLPAFRDVSESYVRQCGRGLIKVAHHWVRHLSAGSTVPAAGT